MAARRGRLETPCSKAPGPLGETSHAPADGVDIQLVPLNIAVQGVRHRATKASDHPMGQIVGL